VLKLRSATETDNKSSTVESIVIEAPSSAARTARRISAITVGALPWNRTTIVATGGIFSSQT
jgi:hypothetical protein